MRMWPGFLALTTLVAVGVSAGGDRFPVAPAGADEVADQDEIVRQIGPRKGVVVVADPDVAESHTALPRQSGMALPAIRFEYDSARFTPLARTQVGELGKALLQPAMLPFRFSLQGHTDSIGGEAYNRDLSVRRAHAVKRHLVEHMGVASDRLIAVGFGESYPVAGISADDERNRRVEIVNRGRVPAGEAVAVHGGAGRRALLVGIGAYQNFSRLPGAPNDARAMAAFLTEHGGYATSDIRLLTDAEATRHNLLSTAREWLVDGTEAGDEVLLFFSGHGFQQWDEDQDEADGKDETLVPVDAYLDSTGQVQGMITDDEIGVLLDDLEGRQVRVVIDACHSGTSTKGVTGIDDSWQHVKTLRLSDGSPVRLTAGPETADAAERGVHKGDLAGVTGVESVMRSDDPDVVVWTAVRADQQALLDREATGDTAGSVYTRRLLWGARDGEADANQDGTVTITELQNYVQVQSEGYCERYPRDCRKGLTPQLEAMPSRSSDIAFGLARSALSRVAAFAKDVLVQAVEQPSPAAAAPVRLRVGPGPRLEPGTEIDITVDSDREGYLTVLDIDADGKMVQLVPNETGLGAGGPRRR
ncbi:MAG: caspase family protein, partial [Gammaproteobacteria bacterium]|nr:caspase family protein [Gammaproteobacteria bacterium]